MSEFKIFAGKNVDDAIIQAQEFYGQDREKLEVEIVSGGSTGIFGLVGKKKAEVRVRVRSGQGRSGGARETGGPGEITGKASGETAESAPAQDAPRERRPQRSGRADRQPRPPRPGQSGQSRQSAEPGTANSANSAGSATATAPADSPEQAASGQPSRNRPARPAAQPRPERARQAAPAKEPARARDGHGEPDTLDDIDDDLRSHEPNVPAGELPEELAGVIKDVLATLLHNITEAEPRIEITGTNQRVNALIFDEVNSGLIIGREGQTLAALQYLVNRIVARRWPDPVRVQVNTGEYREKQDENLRKMALYLADKAKEQGRPQSTKPLSSYHRRVVHMALQEDKSVQTRSKGEGAFKKVIILPRRVGPDTQANG